MITRRSLLTPAFLIAVLLLGAAGAGFEAGASALKITLRKKPIYAPDNVHADDVVAETANWVRASHDRRESAEVEETLGTKNYLSRAYVERNPKDPKRPIVLDLHLAYYTGTIDTVPHVPDRCFVGGGMAIGANLGDLPLKLRTPLWRLEEGLTEKLGYDVWTDRGAPKGKWSGDRRPLPRDPDSITLRTMKFLDGSRDIYAGYFFIANGGHVSRAEGVRALAFDLKSTYAYYLKVQVTSTTVSSGEELASAASGLLSELMGDIMFTVPNWADVQLGNYPPPEATSDGSKAGA